MRNLVYDDLASSTSWAGSGNKEPSKIRSSEVRVKLKILVVRVMIDMRIRDVISRDLSLNPTYYNTSFCFKMLVVLIFLDSQCLLNI